MDATGAGDTFCGAVLAGLAQGMLPVEAAQEITDRLVEAGVKSLLSYVPVHLTVPDGVEVSYSDPVTQMQRMTYYLKP